MDGAGAGIALVRYLREVWSVFQVASEPRLEMEGWGSHGGSGGCNVKRCRGFRFRRASRKTVSPTKIYPDATSRRLSGSHKVGLQRRSADRQGVTRDRRPVTARSPSPPHFHLTVPKSHGRLGPLPEA